MDSYEHGILKASENPYVSLLLPAASTATILLEEHVTKGLKHKVEGSDTRIWVSLKTSVPVSTV